MNLSKDAVKAISEILDEYGNDVMEEIVAAWPIEYNLNVVTREHIQLLGHSNWEGPVDIWNGGVRMNHKRPYGNGDVDQDIRAIFGPITTEQCDQVHKDLAKLVSAVTHDSTISLNSLIGLSFKNLVL